MIGILGGMGTQAGLDFCNKLAILNRGKIDQEYPLFLLYNKANIPGRPESIGVHTGNLSNRFVNNKSKKKYLLVLKSLLTGCQLLKKSKCRFIVVPCNTAHYWYDDLKKKINLPIINMPKEVFNHTLKKCKKNSSIGLLATEGTLKTGVYNKFFDKNYNLIFPNSILQKNSVNKAIKLVKMGRVKTASKIIKPAIDFLLNKKCKKIILGCTELPIAIFAFKSFEKIKTSKVFLDPNLILAHAAMKKYKMQLMTAKERPYVLFVAAVIYSEISKIRKNNIDFSNIDAINDFIGSSTYKKISSGKFHDDWFRKLENNNFIDQDTKKKIPGETIRLLKLQKDVMIKQLIKFPNLYYTQSNIPLEISQRAFDHIWRICESYELWCKETKQENLILLNIID